MDAATVNKECGISGCKLPYRAKGYCDRHYQRWRRGELPHSRYKTCTQEGCLKKRSRHGLCEDHFKKVTMNQEKVVTVETPTKVAPSDQEAKKSESAGTDTIEAGASSPKNV